MRKKIIITLLLATMAMSAVGCNEKSETSKVEASEKITDSDKKNDNKLSEADAVTIVMDRLEKYASFQYYGVVCEIDESFVFEESKLYESLSDDEKQYVYNCYKIKDCKDINEVREHITEYISKELIEETDGIKFDEYLNDICVVFEDELYIFMGDKGGISYAMDTCTIIEYSNKEIVAECYINDPYGEAASNYKYTFVNDNGNWVLVGEERIEDSVIE